MEPISQLSLPRGDESRIATEADKLTLRQRFIATARAATPPLIVFSSTLAVWELFCRGWHVREFLLPAPSQIAVAFMQNASSLLADAALTSLEAATGFVIANIASLAIAVGFCHWPKFERSFYPYTIILKSIPVIAIAPLFVLWFGYGIAGKVVMAAIVAFFPLVVNASLGLKSVRPELLDLMRSMSATWLQVLVKVRLPTAIPSITSALRVSSTLAVVGAIVAELTGAKRGIGFVILIASYNIDTPLLFAAITLAAMIGLLFFAAIVYLESLLASRHYL